MMCKTLIVLIFAIGPIVSNAQNLPVLPSDRVNLLSKNYCKGVKCISSDEGLSIFFDREGRIIKIIYSDTTEYYYHNNSLEKKVNNSHGSISMSYNESIFDSTSTFKTVDKLTKQISVFKNPNKPIVDYLFENAKCYKEKKYYYSNGNDLDSIVEFSVAGRKCIERYQRYGNLSIRRFGTIKEIYYHNEKENVDKFEIYYRDTIIVKTVYLYDENDLLISSASTDFISTAFPLTYKMDIEMYCYDNMGRLISEFDCEESKALDPNEWNCDNTIIKYKYVNDLLDEIVWKSNEIKIYYEFWE